MMPSGTNVVQRLTAALTENSPAPGALDVDDNTVDAYLDGELDDDECLAFEALLLERDDAIADTIDEIIEQSTLITRDDTEAILAMYAAVDPLEIVQGLAETAAAALDVALPLPDRQRSADAGCPA